MTVEDTAPILENRTYAEIAPGDTASLVRTLTLRDAELLAVLTGYGTAIQPVAGRIAGNGNWTVLLVSALLLTKLPGPGTILAHQEFDFLRPILVGKDTRMPDYLVLVATLGGLVVFGLNGFVIGPVIAAIFLVSWDMLAAARESQAVAPSAPVEAAPAAHAAPADDADVPH